MKEKNIPIVVMTDNNLAFAVATLFINLLETKNKDSFYDLNVLITPDFETEHIKNIKSIENKYLNHCKINFVKNDGRFKNITNNSTHIGTTAAYLFCIPEIFHKYDKIIYLDTDLLIFNDLSELFNIDLKDNYTGGVLSIAHYLKEQYYCNHIPIPNMMFYINCGVQLMNLKKIREDSLYDKWIQLIGKYSDSVNQHIINKTCFGHIKLLPFKWNVTQSNEDVYTSNKALLAMTHSEAEQAYKNPAIYHYTNIWKPWKYRDIKYAFIWRQYYNKTDYAKNPLNLTSKYEQLNQKLSFIEKIFSIKNRINNNKKIKILTLLGISIKLK